MPSDAEAPAPTSRDDDAPGGTGETPTGPAPPLNDAPGGTGETPTGPAPHADWPPFARRYPRDPELDQLIDAFAQGNFARVRHEAPLYASRAASPELAAAARDLRQRIEPSRLAVYLLALGVALMLFLFTHYARLH
ncbi:MAG: hypothetical protein EXR75_02775 [Myxococcales bacterium]|nr:hypothetical protein [Myxococcales bacterium]